MAWHEGKPVIGDKISLSVQQIRENFAELGPLTGIVGDVDDLSVLAGFTDDLSILAGRTADLEDVSALSGHTDEILDLLDLQPHVSEILEGRIVEQGRNANGSYVRWENGLQCCWSDSHALAYISGNTLSGTWQFPAQFSVPTVAHLTRRGTSSDYDGVNTIDLGSPYSQSGTVSAGCGYFRAAGAPVFQAGASVQNVFVFAIGWWK